MPLNAQQDVADFDYDRLLREFASHVKGGGNHHGQAFDMTGPFAFPLLMWDDVFLAYKDVGNRNLRVGHLLDPLIDVLTPPSVMKILVSLRAWMRLLVSTYGNDSVGALVVPGSQRLIVYVMLPNDSYPKAGGGDRPFVLFRNRCPFNSALDEALLQREEALRVNPKGANDLPHGSSRPPRPSYPPPIINQPPRPPTMPQAASSSSSSSSSRALPLTCDRAVMTDAIALDDDRNALTATAAVNDHDHDATEDDHDPNALDDDHDSDADDASIDTDYSYDAGQPEHDGSLQDYLRGPRPAFDFFGFSVEALFLTLDGRVDSLEFHRHHDPYRAFEPRPCPLVRVVPHADIEMEVTDSHKVRDETGSLKDLGWIDDFRLDPNADPRPWQWRNELDLLHSVDVCCKLDVKEVKVVAHPTLCGFVPFRRDLSGCIAFGSGLFSSASTGAWWVPNALAVYRWLRTVQVGALAVSVHTEHRRALAKPRNDFNIIFCCRMHLERALPILRKHAVLRPLREGGELFFGRSLAAFTSHVVESPDQGVGTLRRPSSVTAAEAVLLRYTMMLSRGTVTKCDGNFPVPLGWSFDRSLIKPFEIHDDDWFDQYPTQECYDNALGSSFRVAHDRSLRLYED
ncbi:hypothetical protein FOZ62_027530 [Perkinsus olseni]|uniref:Uncharacterized protein n=1 Tax=Perkinsus olseni TaxID=32597 RepID=A0A7J6TJH5_PEROL|nr:hypothetical protein FOZ62_027530 [Perkinsus olseni]